MKKIVLFLILSISILIGADFDWLHSLKKAKELAKKENKKILLMISREDCRSCEYMDSVVFETENIVDYVENFYVPLKLTLKEANEKGFKAFATPTFYFLDKNLKPTKRIVGASAPNTFLKILRENSLN